MRSPFDPQLRFDCPGVPDVRLNADCRDEIIPILRALQHIYGRPQLRTNCLRPSPQMSTGARRSPIAAVPAWTTGRSTCPRRRTAGLQPQLRSASEPRRRTPLLAADHGRRRLGRGHVLRLAMPPRQHHSALPRHHRAAQPPHRRRRPSPPRPRRRSHGPVRLVVVAADIHYPTDSSLIGDGLTSSALPLREASGSPAGDNTATCAIVKTHLRTINRIAKAKGAQLPSGFRRPTGHSWTWPTGSWPGPDLLDPALISIVLAVREEDGKTQGPTTRFPEPDDPDL